jgi:hypothetical protein
MWHTFSTALLISATQALLKAPPAPDFDGNYKWYSFAANMNKEMGAGMAHHVMSDEHVETNIAQVRLALFKQENPDDPYYWLHQLDWEDANKFNPGSCGLMIQVEFDEMPENGDVTSVGIHPDGHDMGALGVMITTEDSWDFETLRFSDINMLKHGVLKEGAPTFLAEKTYDEVPGEWDGPVGLGNEWGQMVHHNHWRLWNYCNDARTDREWSEGLWHCHIWQYSAAKD